MTDLPAPLTPAEADLQDFPFMPLHVARLRDSDLAAEEEPEACWYAVLLWCASWHQLPAGSLPDNDTVLRRLVGLGRDEKTWRKHRDGALRGFVKCSDDRLYHPVVAEQVNAAWSERVAYRDRKQKRIEAASKAAAARWASESQCDAHPEEMRNASDDDAERIPDDTESQCRKGQGQGQGQNPPTPLEDRPPKTYAFAGQTVRLLQRDYDRWAASYHAIADLPAELQALDDWLQGPRSSDAKRKDWFQVVSRSLGRKHDERLAAKGEEDAARAAWEARFPRQCLTESEWRALMGDEEFEAKRATLLIKEPVD